MKILYTAFNGNSNSSKILLDNINIYANNKLYLKNNYKSSVVELIKKLDKNDYDLVISFGQAPLNIDTIKIELVGKNENIYETNYDYSEIKNRIENMNYKVKISRNAGNYLCNNIYYNGLKYIKENCLDCKMIFIHIPKIKNISDMEKLAKIFNSI